MTKEGENKREVILVYYFHRYYKIGWGVLVFWSYYYCYGYRYTNLNLKVSGGRMAQYCRFIDTESPLVPTVH